MSDWSATFSAMAVATNRAEVKEALAREIRYCHIDPVFLIPDTIRSGQGDIEPAEAVVSVGR